MNEIRRLRKKAGLSQFKLAVKAGVTETTVRNWERRGSAHGGSGGRGMTRALLASAVVMDAAGWACTAQGAYGLARVCFSAAVPFIVAWVLASPYD